MVLEPVTLVGTVLGIVTKASLTLGERIRVVRENLEKMGVYSAVASAGQINELQRSKVKVAQDYLQKAGTILKTDSNPDQKQVWSQVVDCTKDAMRYSLEALNDAVNVSVPLRIEALKIFIICNAIQFSENQEGFIEDSTMKVHSFLKDPQVVDHVRRAQKHKVRSLDELHALQQLICLIRDLKNAFSPRSCLTDSSDGASSAIVQHSSSIDFVPHPIREIIGNWICTMPWMVFVKNCCDLCLVNDDRLCTIMQPFRYLQRFSSPHHKEVEAENTERRWKRMTFDSLRNELIAIDKGVDSDTDKGCRIWRLDPKNLQIIAEFEPIFPVHVKFPVLTTTPNGDIYLCARHHGKSRCWRVLSGSGEWSEEMLFSSKGAKRPDFIAVKDLDENIAQIAVSSYAIGNFGTKIVKVNREGERTAYPRWERSYNPSAGTLDEHGRLWIVSGNKGCKKKLVALEADDWMTPAFELALPKDALLPRAIAVRKGTAVIGYKIK